MDRHWAWIREQKVKLVKVESDDPRAILAALDSQPKDDGLMFFVATARDESFLKKLGKSFTNVLKRRKPHAQTMGSDCIFVREASQEELQNSILELNRDRSSNESSE